MNIGKFDKMYKFLSDYSYEISKNAPSKLKCGKCKNILVNACQVPCGCRYCHYCVKGMLENGIKYCPGSIDDCKDEYLSHNHLDYTANKKISKLVLKCPEEMCSYECELINMEEHLRICGKKSVKCPFSDLGCDDKKMATEMVNEHCQLSNFIHSKILIEMIDNIKNEIGGLKIKEEKNRNEIETLTQNLKLKNEIIDSINEEVKLIKLEKEKLWHEFDSLKKNFGNKIEEISEEVKKENLQLVESISKETYEIKMENDKLAQQVNISKVELENKIEDINDKIERQNETIKIQKDKHQQECKILEKNLERKTEEVLAEIKKEKQTRIESINEETKSIMMIMMETNKKSEITIESRINKLSNIINKFGCPMIEWTIDKLDERRNKNENICSKFFTAVTKPYKLHLWFYANGGNLFKGKGCSIFLRISSSVADELLPWPFKADVTIEIVNKTNPNASKSITKYCQIDKPSNDSFTSSFPIQFDYSYSDLTRDGVILDNFFIVECFINFK